MDYDVIRAGCMKTLRASASEDRSPPDRMLNKRVAAIPARWRGFPRPTVPAAPDNTSTPDDGTSTGSYMTGALPQRISRAAAREMRLPYRARKITRSVRTAQPPSSPQPHDYRHMVRRLLPTTHRPQDLIAGKARHQIRGHPDMVEAAAAVARLPILGAIAPPGIKLLLRRDEAAHGIDEFGRGLELGVAFDLDRRVADHVE